MRVTYTVLVRAYAGGGMGAGEGMGRGVGGSSAPHRFPPKEFPTVMSIDYYLK